MPRKNPSSSLRIWMSLFGIGILAALFLGLVFVRQRRPDSESNAQPSVLSPSTLQSQSIAPTPPAVAEVQVQGPDGQWGPIPTWTPFPTLTPRPTPTRQPGPTATAMPIQSVGLGGFDLLVYAQDGSVTLRHLVLGSSVEVLQSAETLHMATDSDVTEVVPSPDGRRILLMKSGFPGGYPYVFDRDTNQTYPLLDENSNMSGRFFGWHPDGQKILFWPTIDELWLIDVISRQRTILALPSGSVQGAAISPTGQQIAYVTFADNPSQTGQYGLWIVSTAGSDAQLSFRMSGAGYLFGWSPNGKHLLYMGAPSIPEDGISVEKPQRPLWISEPDGTNARGLSLPYLNGYGYEPTWSPDGESIASVGLLEEGTPSGCAATAQAKWPECLYEGVGIYTENIESGTVRFLTNGLEPVWSPDGKYIAFSALRDGTIGTRIISLEDNKYQEVSVDNQMLRSVNWIASSEVAP